MQADKSRNWPWFELVKFAEPTGIPNGWDAELNDKGAPKSLFRRYRAATALSLIDTRGYGWVVRFGSTMLTGSVCQDPHTRAILWVTNQTAGPVWLVNASLDQFIRSVRIVIHRFPFESRAPGDIAGQDDAGVNWDEAVAELTQLLNQIDSQALLSANGYWQTFLDDVAMGDFSLSSVLETHER